ncbi:amino acid/amide ABC transporter substrate-binding protein (HAAT family) [Homoserinimonas aerilata]|uniref:Amino acid/amide ABC transporter substrate-binding protein (HAAT family) n=1 Tax=Homoserinimonas aerilata TaxID=1162970 RepID=A0A542YK38_9MICO|nr:substrate-binding domain-containing protein [Homoserinimonas aerilata]TQL48477.1 amino acid/amide ABC transporter substrate-binding protein (HAAT family) [Homoserinimonas aerilata]
MHKKVLIIPALLATVGLALAGCAPSDPGTGGNGNGGGDAAAPVDIALVYSQTGALAAYGEAYINGFEAGLDYATDGTGAVDGRELNIQRADDAGDADKAVTAVKDFIGQGFKIVAGTASSGIALAVAEQAAQNKILYISGPAAADAITGINDYTFRSGRQTYQDIATAGTFLDDPKGQTVVVYAQDNAFGQGNAAGVAAVLGAKGANVVNILVPEDATEFTPFAQQIVQASPDLVFVAWAGASSAAMWQAMEQQSVFDAAPIVTGLGDVATYGAYGAQSGQIKFLNHYFAGATDNAENKAMISYLEANGHEADLFSPDGFNAALMIVQAVREGGGDNVDDMVASLEGWSFNGPKGEMTIRAEDHAVIQPMFQVALVADGDSWKPELIAVADAELVAPPIAE